MRTTQLKPCSRNWKRKEFWHMNNFAVTYEQSHCWNPQYNFPHNISKCSLLYCCCCFCCCCWFTTVLFCVLSWREQCGVWFVRPLSASINCSNIDWTLSELGVLAFVVLWRFSEQELWHTNNFVVTYGQSHALLNSTIWALFTHLSGVCFLSYCSVDLFCVLVIVVMVCFVCPKLQTWLATCFGPDKKLHSTKEPSYSLLFPDISQVSTCLTQRKPNYNCLDSLNQTQSASSRQLPNHSLHPPDGSQIIACILPTLQSASSEQEPSCGPWTPGRYLWLHHQDRISKQKPSYNMHSHQITKTK